MVNLFSLNVIELIVFYLTIHLFANIKVELIDYFTKQFNLI